MLHKTNLFTTDKKQRLLHVAPEEIFYRKFSQSNNIDYVPCAKFGDEYPDLYPAGTINIDITAIDLPDDNFDVIYCSHVLEHIPDDAKAMQELRRVLKPGGWAMLQVPLDISRATTYEDFTITKPEERELAFGQNDHVRVYGNDYKLRLEAAGFIVNQIKYTESFTANELFRYGFLKGEDIFICTK
ncbi:MAG: class I SAM-dependent methyltransferase [Ferruginibacter sp.]